jgi:hypothetical protein
MMSEYKELSEIEGLCGCTLIDCIPAKANVHRANATHADAKARLEKGLLSISVTEALKEWTRLSNLGKTLGSRYAEEPSVLPRYQEMFKTILFGGDFDFKLCPIHLIEFRDDGWDIGDQDVPHCKSTKLLNASGKIESHIGICVIEAQIDNYPNRLRIYLGRILHQMIHSYEDLHVCSCTDCTLRLKAEDPLNRGGTRHQTFFLGVSQMFRQFLKKEVKLHIYLGRSNAVAAELKKSGTPREASIDAKLEKLGFDPADIWEIIRDPETAGRRSA